MTINAINKSRRYKVLSDGSRVDVVKGTSALAGPALFTLDAESGSDGAAYSGSSTMLYSTARAYSGSKSIRCPLSHGQPPVTCGGSVWFGGRFTLPTMIPEGYSVWFRARFYLPSTVPMGYCFGTSDTGDAATCGKPADGSGTTKWLVMAPDTGTSRLYMNLMTPRRAMGLDNGLRLVSEPQNDGNFVDNTTVIPRDQWFSLQIQINLSSATNGGYIRAWIDDTYIGQHTKKTLDASGYKLKEWGLGDYWSGVPWTDGNVSRTADFWMDDVIIATDYTGYGAPLTTDSGGRPYIANSITVANI